MKQLMTLFAMALLCSTSVNTLAQDNKENRNNVKAVSNPEDVYATMNLPYKAIYSSQFVPGNPEYAKVVLQAWKDYEDNTLDNSAQFFADTVVIYLADGMMVKGRDNVINGMKAFRGSFSSVKIFVDAWMPTNSLDRDKETFCIWAREIDQKADGTQQRSYIHELWSFNKDGKIDMMQQFVQQRK